MPEMSEMRARFIEKHGYDYFTLPRLEQFLWLIAGFKPDEGTAPIPSTRLEDVLEAIAAQLSGYVRATDESETPVAPLEPGTPVIENPRQ